MGKQQEAVVRSMLDGLFVDLDKTVDHYADDATYHAVAWRPPVVGRDAIRAALAPVFGLQSEYRYTILNIASTDVVVFIEVGDAFKFDGRDMTMHWTSVLEINPGNAIIAQRDYYDMKEFEAQLA